MTIEATMAGTQVLAFASPVGSSGQTSMVANAAWVLATVGHRVLVLDWGSREPLVSDYLRPYLVDETEPAESLSPALRLLADGNPHAAQLQVRLFTLPGGGRVHAVTASVAFTSPPTLPPGAGTGARLRELLQETSYDYVLIDCPQPVSEEALAQLAQLCDGVAVSFRPRFAAAQSPATAMVQDLSRQAPVSLRLAVVPSRTSPDRSRAADQLERTRKQLAALPRADRQLNRVEPVVIEMPSQSVDLGEEVLPLLLGDEPFRAALLEILAALTGGAVTEWTPVEPRIRARYERGLGIAEGATEDIIDLVYDPADRRWVDWIGWQLKHAGVGVQLWPVPDSRPLPASGRELLVVGARAWRDPQTRAAAGDAAPGLVVRVVIDEEDTEFSATPALELQGRSERFARAELLAHLGLVIPYPEPLIPETTPRFPGADLAGAARETNAPPQNPLFSGRSAELENLRDMLLSPPGVTALIGDTGVGKSEIAREYAARFIDDYDFVWWIDARSEESINAALRPLGPRLSALYRDIDPRGTRLPYFAAETQGPLSILTILDDPSFSRPYLLIFDNLDDTSVLELVPRRGYGHVVITSRAEELPGIGHTLMVQRLEPADSIALLRSYAPQLSVADAGMLAEAVDHFPLTLRMAGAWTRQTMELLMRRAPASAQATASTVALMFRDQVGTPDTADSAALSGIRRTWKALQASLQASPDGRLAGRLAELTSHMSAEVSLKLLRSGPMVRALSDVSGADGEALAADAFPLDEVFWTGVLLGVFDIGWGTDGVLRIHRALQQAIREGMDPRDRADRRSRVQRALAEYAPTAAEEDGPGTMQRLAELQHHLTACEAVSSDDREVRRWVIRQVRYMQLQTLAPVSKAALQIAGAALAVWPDDILRWWLELERANILRWQGRFDEARTVDERVRQRLRRALGPGHLRTHITGRSLGGDLRAAGRYERAKAEDGAAYEGIRQLVGEEHRHALMAAHNFALSSYLDGDVHTAMITEQGILERRTRLFGPTDPYTWWSAANLGTYQRELGDYQGSAETLSRARIWISELLGPVPADQTVVLRVDRSFAATKRRMGRVHLAKDDDAGLIEAYRRLLPPDHPDIWSCRLSLAADQHAMNDSRTAARLAQECLDHYLGERWPAGHPFAAICRLNLSVYLRGANRVDEAAEAGIIARDELRAALSDTTHPWNLAADLNVARNLLAVGDVRKAADLAQRVHTLCQEDLPPRHPYIAAAADTVQAVTQARAELPHQERPKHLDIDIDIFYT